MTRNEAVFKTTILPVTFSLPCFRFKESVESQTPHPIVTNSPMRKKPGYCNDLGKHELSNKLKGQGATQSRMRSPT